MLDIPCIKNGAYYISLRMKRARSQVSLSEDQFHAVSRALADPRRFAIFEQVAVAREGMACSALREHDVISPATISHHLKELHEAGLIEIERQGRGSNLFLNRATYQAYVDRLASL